MKPLMKPVRDFIRDDLDFVSHLPSEVNTYMISLDVLNLHSNIPHDYRIESIKYWLEAFHHEPRDHINGNFTTENMEFILENNYFMINKHSTDNNW